MSGLHWFKLYPKDMAADAHVKAMTAAAFGAYMRLLMSHWELGEIPDDEFWMARTAGMPLASFRRIWPQLEPCFTRTKDGHAWVQKRMHGELEKVRMKAVKNRVNGTKGADIRWQGGSELDSQAKKLEAKKLDPAPSPKTSKVRAAPKGDFPIAVKSWHDAYQAKTGQKYVWAGGKDGKHLKELLKQSTPEELETRMRRFFEDPWAADKLEFGVFRSCFNRLAVAPSANGKHVPAGERTRIALEGFPECLRSAEVSQSLHSWCLGPAQYMQPEDLQVIGQTLTEKHGCDTPAKMAEALSRMTAANERTPTHKTIRGLN